MPVEDAVRQRRSVRDFARGALTLDEISQLLWAGQGITAPEQFRTAPSAGALYPLGLMLIAEDVENLEPGVYRYVPETHALDLVMAGHRLAQLASAALGQGCVAAGAAALVFFAVYEHTTRKYGQRGVRYVHMEVGHAAQNVHLEAVALGLGTVMVGAFDDARVAEVAELSEDEAPLAIIPVGRRLPAR